MRAKKLHPDWPRDPVHAAAILSEEVGELVQAANDFKWSPLTSIGNTEEYRTRMREEVIQVAAMAIRFLNGIDSYER